MKKTNIIIILSIFTLFILSACAPNLPAKADDLAKCLTEKGAVMYGTEWCPHCAAQKEMFGSSFEYVTYVDCDKNKRACVNAGVKGYPTWQINEANYEGTQSLYDLAKNSGCTLTPTTQEGS